MLCVSQLCKFPFCFIYDLLLAEDYLFEYALLFVLRRVCKIAKSDY